MVGPHRALTVVAWAAGTPVLVIVFIDVVLFARNVLTAWLGLRPEPVVFWLIIGLSAVVGAGIGIVRTAPEPRSVA